MSASIAALGDEGSPPTSTPKRILVISVQDGRGDFGAMHVSPRGVSSRSAVAKLDYRSVDIYTIKTFSCENGLCHSPRSGKR